MSVEVRPARVNTMAPEGKDHLLRVVRQERAKFYDLIDSATDETWKTATHCTEWEIRDQVGHLVDVTEGYIERFALARAKQPFADGLGLPGMAELLDTGSSRFRSPSRSQLITRLKETWGVRVSGDQGGSWKLQLKDGKLTYEEASLAGLPVVFNFDPNDWVLTAYQRFPGGAAIGDRALAYRIRRLFFKI